MSGLITCILAVLPGIVFLANRRGLRSKIPLLVLFGVTCLTEYGLIQICVRYRRAELQEEVDRFDLDHNGLLSGAESTREANIAVSRASSDTGLNLAPITGVPYAIFWTTFNFAILGYLERRGKSRPNGSTIAQF